MRRRIEFFAIVATALLVAPFCAEAQTTKFGDWLFEPYTEACVASTPSPQGFGEAMSLFYNQELSNAGQNPFLFFSTKKRVKLNSESLIFGYDDNSIQIVKVLDYKNASSEQLAIDTEFFDERVLSKFRSKGAVSIGTEEDVLFDYFSLKGFSDAYDAVKRCFK